MNPKLVVDMFMSNEIKVIQDTEKMRMSIVEFEGNYCVLKKYIGRNLKNVYQNIIDQKSFWEKLKKLIQRL